MGLHDINKALEIEKLHRYVFDNIYVQNKEKNEEDDLIIKKYNELIVEYPHFRKDLYDYDNKLFNRYRYK